MDSDKKYKKVGGSSCAVNSCPNNRKKLQLWKNSMCEIHKEVHDQCPCLIPFKFYTMPTDEHIKLEWIKAISRKILPKTVYVCSKHFLDGMPTQRNPFPKLKLGYERKVTPGRRKLQRQEAAPKRQKIDFEHNSAKDEPEEDNEDSTAGCSNMDISETNENYPEAVFNFNVVLPVLEAKSTQYLESDIVVHEDHLYAMKLSDTQSTFTQTNKTLTEEKGVQSKI